MGLRIRSLGAASSVWDFGFGIHGFGVRILGTGLEFGVWDLSSRVFQGSGLGGEAPGPSYPCLSHRMYSLISFRK